MEGEPPPSPKSRSISLSKPPSESYRNKTGNFVASVDPLASCASDFISSIGNDASNSQIAPLYSSPNLHERMRVTPLQLVSMEPLPMLRPTLDTSAFAPSNSSGTHTRITPLSNECVFLGLTRSWKMMWHLSFTSWILIWTSCAWSCAHCSQIRNEREGVRGITTQCVISPSGQGGAYLHMYTQSGDCQTIHHSAH